MRRPTPLLSAAGALCLLAAGLVGPLTPVAASTAGSGGSIQGLQRVGTVNLRGLPGATVPQAGVRARPEADKQAQQASVALPDPATVPVTRLHAGATGFSGLNAVQSGRLNGFDVEPPDQGLCAYQGTVMEQVNLAVRVYTDRGTALTRPVSLNAFFGQAAPYDPATKRYGPFLSDPRCYHDAQTGRWYSTVLSIDVNARTGDLGRHSSLLIAVSATSDPTGDYAIFAVDTTDNGKGGGPRLANCPCFGDQPRLGADANGIYVSTDIYPIQGLFDSNGGGLYAVSKTGLAAAASGSGAMPPVVSIHVGATKVDGHPANALQPAQTPPGGSYAPDTEYFLNTPDFNGFATMGGQGAHAVVLWALTGTSSLGTATPRVTLTHAMLPSQPYAPPVPARQRSGPHPLGASQNEPLPRIESNDDRMQQVVYNGGMLASALNTGIGTGRTASRDGIAWFVVRPGATSGGGVTGTVARQGYVAVDGGSVVFPAIAVNASGAGAMVFTLSGAGYYPSAAYTGFTMGSGAGGSVHANGVGAAPADGFTCYPPYSDGACRWGDYSAAVAQDASTIVMATEYIPGPRDTNSNWGTFATRYTP